MAQPQSQPSAPTSAAPAFSPPTSQQSPSPTPSSAAFALPPNKRPKLSPAPSSQPQSPYNAYAPSPGATGASPGQTPSSAAASPQFAGGHLPTPTTATTPNAITAPAMSTPPTVATNPNQPQGYTNGHMTASAPDAHASQTSPPPGSGAPTPYTAATMAPIAPQPSRSGAAAESPATPGSMAPPNRPPDRPTKEYEYEPTDMLAGTGIDLRAEEQIAAEMLLNSQDVTYGFPQYPPGPKDSFYGAGGMNQPPEHVQAQSQEELAAIAAKRAWDAASKKLAAARSQELNSPFLTVSVVHRKLEKFAKDQGLDLHLDYKNAQNPQDRRRLAEDQPPPQVKVSTKTLPDGTIVTTSGSYVAQETFLADQLSLLSLACKQRLRTLTEDANRLSTNRQESSHGQIPDVWADVAAPLPGMAAVEQEAAAAASGEATDGDASSRKRSQSTANLDPVNGVPVKLHKIEKNETISTMREVTRADRDWEESRLRRRNARTEGTKDSATPSRAGSVAPGTPGATPGEGGSKKETKKEQRKTAAAKAAEASNHASQNITSSMFVGKTGGLFGKKKYDWMNPKGRSGGSTPARAGTPGAGAAAGGTPSGGGAQAESMPLTTESRTRLGNWREDKEKGRGIQLRDWIAALEADGVDGAVLQKAYDKLDTSGPR